MPLKPASAGKFLFVCAIFFAATVLGQPAENNFFFNRDEKEFQRAQKIFRADQNNSTNAWQFARAAFDLADLATNQTQRAEVAKAGIAACQQLLAREPKSAPGHYYLAMNLGELADAEAPSLAAYKLVREIEREFTTAAQLDQKFDFAGAPRCLGLLYRDAPGWPLSIGNKKKAREWLERAAALAPDYPDNQLNLAETFLKWRERAAAEAELKKIEAGWPAAQTNFAGEFWGQNLADWKTRRAAARAEFQKVFHEVPGK